MGVVGALRRNTRVKIKKKLSRGVPLKLSFKERFERKQLGRGGWESMGRHPKDMPTGPRREIASFRKV